MRMPLPPAAPSSYSKGDTVDVRRKCPKCEAEAKVRRKLDAAGTEISEAPDDFMQALGHGQPLSSSERRFFEPRFGYDFSGVRVHADAQAAEAARAVDAQAFTVGKDVVFGKWQYAPGTSRGQRLLAHELTHVVQQGTIARQTIVMRSPDKKAFDEKKMFEIARKSKIVVDLEKKAKDLGFSYGGQVSGEHSYTSPSDKKIYITKELSNEKAALHYAYELQNAINMSTKYSKIFEKASKGGFKDASEFAEAMLNVEVEALITQAEVSIELGLEASKAVAELVKKYKKGELKLDELKKKVFELAAGGIIDGMNAKKYYEKKYKEVYEK